MTPAARDRAYSSRKISNRIATALAATAVALAVLPLVSILGFVGKRGLAALGATFFFEPIGAQGLGMANAVFGTVQLVVLASAMGIPVGILAGVYLAE
jgi:phosphate transport system permease protein